MAFLQEKKFEFRSQALSEDTFGVVRFRGTEGLSRCYEFEIDLVSGDPEIDMTAVLENPATFTILREDGDIPFHGILTDFEQLHEIDTYVFYRAVLVPKLWWLSLTHHNQVLLNKTVPDMIEGVLKDGDLTNLDFEFRLGNDYPAWDYICQYGESHLNFVSRWMERDGIYYYFEQGDNSEKVIITDMKIAHGAMSEGTTMYYSPPSGLDESHREEVIKAFVCRQKMLPKTLRLRDYNYETPSMEIIGTAEVSPNGRGEIYIYGEHFRTTEEGNELAKIRAEEYLCRERRFHGESTIPYLRPGYLFDLEDHYRKDVNRQYLTVEMEHEGSQSAFLLAGIQKGLSKIEETPYYRNSFVAIPADVQYRPPLTTSKPRFYGTINARIDAAETGKYAELDDQGRYKVILPFDESGRKNGKASAFLRMAQPYAGTDHGMHFPLHKGTEVLLTFTDGDPDRPLVAAAVPNPETPSPVTAENQTMSTIQTAGKNKIAIEDQEGSERILMHAPKQDSFIRIGAPNDPPSGDVPDAPTADWKGVAVKTGGVLHIKAQAKNEIIGGEVISLIIGDQTLMNMITRQLLVFGLNVDLKMGGSVDFRPLHHKFKEQTITLNGQRVRVSGDGVKITGGTTTVTGNSTKVTGDGTTVNGQNTTVTGDHTRVTGNNTTVNGEKTTVSGNNTQVTGGTTTVTGDRTEVSGGNTTVTGEQTTVSGNNTTVTGDNTQVTGNNNTIGGQNNIISVDTIML